jgi:hypothetical protein
MGNAIRAIAGLIFAVWLIWYCFWAMPAKPQPRPDLSDPATFLRGEDRQ